VLSGAWFALGGLIGPTWVKMQMVPGTPVGDTATRTLEQIGFFTGLGVAIVLLGAMALGRFSVISVGDARRAEREADSVRAADEAPAAATTSTGRSEREAESEETPADTTAEAGRRRFTLRRRVTTTDETDEAPATEETAAASRS
jgi:hypothetical protein